MPVLSKEARIALAIQALHTSKEMSIQRTASIYNVPEATLQHRIKGHTAKPKTRNSRHQLTLSKEETLVRYILNLDTQGFPPQISSVEDMANSLLAMRYAQPVGT